MVTPFNPKRRYSDNCSHILNDGLHLRDEGISGASDEGKVGKWRAILGQKVSF